MNIKNWMRDEWWHIRDSVRNRRFFLCSPKKRNNNNTNRHIRYEVNTFNKPVLESSWAVFLSLSLSLSWRTAETAGRVWTNESSSFIKMIVCVFFFLERCDTYFIDKFKNYNSFSWNFHSKRRLTSLIDWYDVINLFHFSQFKDSNPKIAKFKFIKNRLAFRFPIHSFIHDKLECANLLPIVRRFDSNIQWLNGMFVVVVFAGFSMVTF